MWCWCAAGILYLPGSLRLETLYEQRRCSRFIASCSHQPPRTTFANRAAGPVGAAVPGLRCGHPHRAHRHLRHAAGGALLLLAGQHRSAAKLPATYQCHKVRSLACVVSACWLAPTCVCALPCTGASLCCVCAAGGVTLHIRKLAGHNSHHIVEATFKSFARALRQATEVDPRRQGMIASSKGVLTQQ